MKLFGDKDGSSRDGSTRVGGDTRPSGTTAGADVTSRMTGSHTPSSGDRVHNNLTDNDRDNDGRDDRLEGRHGGVDHDRDNDGRDDRLEGRHGGLGADHDRDNDGRDDRVEGRGDSNVGEHRPTAAAAPAAVGRRDVRDEERVVTKPAKTSAAATFALVFGLSALICALAIVLSPLAILFGVIAIVLAIVGFKKTKLRGVTGRGLAIGGLVLGLLGLVLGGAVLAGIAVGLNSPQVLDRVQTQLDNARNNLPSGSEVRQQVPGQ